MKLTPDIHDNMHTLQYGSYVRIDDDTRFPPTSSDNLPGVYSHYAVLTKSVDMFPGLSVAMTNTPNQTYVQKYGFNGDLDANHHGDVASQTIWSYSGAYPWSSLGSPATIHATSTDTNDTGVELHVEGLDENWDLASQRVTLNGTNNIPLSGSWRRVFRAYTCNDTKSNGDIHVELDTDNTVIAHVPITEQQTLMAVYTVPRGYTAYLTCFDCTISRNEDMLFRLRTREPGGVFRTQHIAQVYQTPYRYDYTVFKRVDEMTDIEFTGEPTNNNVAAHAAFDLILIKNV